MLCSLFDVVDGYVAPPEMPVIFSPAGHVAVAATLPVGPNPKRLCTAEFVKVTPEDESARTTSLRVSEADVKPGGRVEGCGGGSSVTYLMVGE
jgi:hypothetical protein